MKNSRQKKIMELIAAKSIETQEQLLQELTEAGFKCTQATISRDIKELRIVKSLDGFGSYRYCVPRTTENDKFDTRFRVIFRECVTHIDYAQNLVVVKTVPGLGSAAGANIDSLHMASVLGTLAGDDTALVVMRDTDSARELCNELRKMLD